MNLTAATHALELVTSSANAVAWAVSWVDVDKSGASTAATPGSNQGVVSSATTTTIVAAPSASIYRAITGITIVATGGAQTAIVQKDVSATDYVLARGVLAVNEALCFEDGAGWYAQNANGERKGVGLTGAAGSNGSGTVLGSGTTIVDFGSAGSSHLTQAVTGQTAILAGSLVYCWVKPEATTDHSADEHVVESLRVFASDIVAGVGFTIHAINTSELISVRQEVRRARFSGTGQDAGPGQPPRQLVEWGGEAPLLFGKYSVGWFYTQ